MSFTTHPLSARCRTHRTEPGYCSNTRRNPGRPRILRGTRQANGAERAKAHTTISSLSSGQQKAGFNRFVITYTDSALNSGGINWASPAGTQVATWNDALYQGLTSEVKSVDDLFKIKPTTYAPPLRGNRGDPLFQAHRRAGGEVHGNPELQPPPSHR